MIDFHTHSLISDGELLPSELVHRARVRGYSAMAITDHMDESNIEAALGQLVKVCKQLSRATHFHCVPGAELTHIPPSEIARMVKKARSSGAAVVVGHGETLTEPVAPGTNEAFIRAKVDILAHPGLVTAGEALLAVKNSVHFEITCRAGHGISNGHVAAVSKRHGVKMLINSDAHSPGDLVSDETALKVALGAGLDKTDFRKIEENAQRLLKKVFGLF